MVHQLIDMKFLFFCRATYANKQGLSPIVLRIIYRGQRADIFTGLNCNPDSWNATSQRVSGKDKTTSVINENLDDVTLRCKEKFDEMKYSKKPFILDEFVLNIKGKEEKPETIINYLSKKVENLRSRVGIDIAAATHQKYIRCIKHIEEFLRHKFKNSDIAIASLNGALLMEFFYFLRTQKNNSHNTSVNYIKCLKTVLMPAIKNGILLHDPFLELKIAPKITMRGFLSIDEIGRLENLKNLTPGLSQALDIFLFACYTGMAYIDIKNFSKKHLIKEADGSFCIHKAR
jgi:hypothetical protein